MTATATYSRSLTEGVFEYGYLIGPVGREKRESVGTCGSFEEADLYRAHLPAKDAGGELLVALNQARALLVDGNFDAAVLRIEIDNLIRKTIGRPTR